MTPFEPDILLPRPEPLSSLAGLSERRLLGAILEAAIEDVQKTRGWVPAWKRKMQEETRFWFESDSTALLTFRWICTNLSLDYEKVREKVLRPTARSLPSFQHTRRRRPS
jgi:hypothetical protein